jgi:O-antigen/teichoic acid export membrane protein
VPEPGEHEPAPSLERGNAPSEKLLHPSRLRSAALWRFGFLGIQGGFSLALFIAVGQVLPADAFSACAVALGVLVIAQTLGDFGLSQALATDLPARAAAIAAEHGVSAADGLRAAGAYAVGLATLAVLVICATGALLVPDSAAPSVLLISPTAAAAMAVSGADGLMRSVGDFRRPLYLVTLSRAAYFIGVPVAAITESSGWTCAAITAGGVMGSSPAAGYLLGLARRHPRGPTSDVFRASVPLGVSQLFVIAGGRIDTILLGALSTLFAAAAFEGVWRVHQVGQYLAGGLATTLAPFLATMVGESNFDELRTLVRRAIIVTGLAGLVWGASLYLFRDLLGDLLMPELAGDVGEALAIFALLAPATYIGWVCTVTLSPSRIGRMCVVACYGLGATLNVVLVFLLADSEGLPGAATACGLGLAVTNLGLMIGCAIFLRRTQ